MSSCITHALCSLKCDVILGDPGADSRDETIIGTAVKFPSKARRAPGNIALTDDFRSELNSNFLIGRKFSAIVFFPPNHRTS